MSIFSKAVLAAIGLLCAVPAAASGRSAAQADTLKTVVDGAFRPLLAQFDIPGMVVAVTIDGEEHFFTYGVASRDGNVPVSKDTIFEIGSVSKVFTATLAAYAETKGKLSWNDRPGKFIPELRGAPLDQATVEHLGTYTAGGLPLQFPQNVTDTASGLKYLQQWKPAAQPGVQRTYSNPSLGLFGHVAARALGEEFPKLMQETLFRNLRLSHTYIHVPANEQSRYAWGYNAANEPVRVNPGVFAAEAYGVKSTAADMIRFVELNMQPEKLSGPMRRAVKATQIGRFRIGPMVQGLGWEQYAFPATLPELLAGNSPAIIMQANSATRVTPAGAEAVCALFNKTGSTNGFGAYVAYVPGRRTGIVMLANKNFPIEARVRAAYAVLQRAGETSDRKPDGARASERNPRVQHPGRHAGCEPAGADSRRPG